MDRLRNVYEPFMDRLWIAFGTLIDHLIANLLGILWMSCDCLQLANERVPRFLKMALLNIKIVARKKVLNVLNILFEICEKTLRALFVAYTIYGSLKILAFLFIVTMIKSIPSSKKRLRLVVLCYSFSLNNSFFKSLYQGGIREVPGDERAMRDLKYCTATVKSCQF